MITKHYSFLHHISKMLFQKLYVIQKNVNVIFALKLTNSTTFYDKLLINLYYCNFTLNLVKKNDVKLPYACGNFTRSEFYGIFESLVLASTSSKICVYRISRKSIYFYNIAPPCWICPRQHRNVEGIFGKYSIEILQYCKNIQKGQKGF